MVVTEKKINSTEIYDGHILKVYKDDVSLDGKPAIREVVRHKGAAAQPFICRARHPCCGAASSGGTDYGRLRLRCGSVTAPF